MAIDTDEVSMQIKPDSAQGPLNVSPLSVACVDPELGFGGGEAQVLGLAVRLRSLGHDVTLLCDPTGELWRRAQELSLRCLPLAIRNSLDVFAGAKLRSYVKRNRWNVVHFHTARAHALAPFVGGQGCLRVVTRRMDYRPNRLFAPWLFNRCVDHVIAISHAVVDVLIAAGVRPQQITLVPSGVDCERFRPPTMEHYIRARQEFKLPDKEVVVGTVGALEERKGQRFLIEAIAMLRQQGLRLKCLLAGDGSLRYELQALVDRLDLNSQVRILNRLEDPRSMLWAIDVFVMPSLKEGLGVALLEAMACERAVVGSKVGGIPEVIEDGLSGLLVPPGNAAALADALARLVATPDVRVQLGSAARRRVLDKFSLDTMAKGTLAVYYACLDKRR